MDKNLYQVKVNSLFSKVSDIIDKADLDIIDMDSTYNQLSIIDQRGREILISKQEFLYEVWVSSPLSGAHHFLFEEKSERWISKRNQFLEIFDFLEKEISILIGKTINLR